jgi:hypothetical protein
LPIIVLTARAYELDIVVGLDAGAVDYVPQPFRLAELLARLRAQLRHVEPGAERTTIGPLQLDIAARRAWFNGDLLDLRAKEFDLLAALAANPGRVMRRDELMRDVWDQNFVARQRPLTSTWPPCARSSAATRKDPDQSRRFVVSATASNGCDETNLSQFSVAVAAIVRFGLAPTTPPRA